MKPESYEMNVPASVAAGTPLKVERYREKTVHLHGAGVWTAQVEGVIGAHTDWTLLGTAVSGGSPGFVSIPQAVTQIRIRTTAYTSGTPAAHFGGFDARSE